MYNQEIAQIKDFEIKVIDINKIDYKVLDAALEGGIGDGPAMADLMIEIDQIYYADGDLEEFYYPWELSMDQRGFLAKIPLSSGGTLLEYIEKK